MALTPRSKRIFSETGLLYAAIIWGATFFVVKGALTDVDPVMLVCYRFGIASALLALYLLIRRQPMFEHLKAGFILGVVLWLLYVPQTIGLKYTTASNSGFITGLFVVFVPLLAHYFFKKQISIWQWGAFLISLGGLWLLTGGVSQINFGDLITLVAAFCYALHLLLCDHYVRKDIDPVMITFQQFALVAILSALTGLLFDLPFSVASADTLWVIVFLALFPTLSAFLIQLFAQKHTSPLRVSLIFTMEPVFAAIFAWTIGGEMFVLRSAIGGLVIFLAMMLSEVPMKRSVM